MSQRMYDIINELEIDYGVQLHANDIPDVLCDGNDCRSADCSCWREFEYTVKIALNSQLAEDQHTRSAKMLNKSNLREAL